MGMSDQKHRKTGPKDSGVSRSRGLRSVELFTGAGGLALGIEQAGFKHDTVVERDKNCCETIRENLVRGFTSLNGWRLFPGDVREFDYSTVNGEVDLLAGGPPCQPFSIGGKHKAFNDQRDMFPQVVRAVRELKPRAILVENVKGLTRKTFANYFSYIVLQLSHPEIAKKEGEEWTTHRDRLERYHTKGSWSGLEYNVVPRLLNAANYGVPQKRERVFFVGFRSDLGIEWTFPEETHSLEALLVDQFITGNYWERHCVAKRNRPTQSDRIASRMSILKKPQNLFDEQKQAWRTVRDAIAGLPDPETSDGSAFHNHRQNPGARSYVGHTGSPLDEPAKTLKAGDHGVPGGENALIKPDGSIRYFTVREAARIQTFPDDYVLHGAWSESMRQLGNAVPVQLGYVVAAGVRQKLATLR
jgi:DNA (cytosine-5)-methyltransferase 1